MFLVELHRVKRIVRFYEDTFRCQASKDLVVHRCVPTGDAMYFRTRLKVDKVVCHNMSNIGREAVETMRRGPSCRSPLQPAFLVCQPFLDGSMSETSVNLVGRISQHRDFSLDVVDCGNMFSSDDVPTRSTPRLNLLDW